MKKRNLWSAAALLTVTLVLSGCSSHGQKHEIGKPQLITQIPLTERSDEVHKWHTENSELYTALEDGFSCEYVIINTYTMHMGYSDAESFILTRMRYVQKAKKLQELIPKALEHMYGEAAELYEGRTVTHSEEIKYPSWQYLAATLPYAEDECYLLYNIMCLEISVEETENSAVHLTVSAAPVPVIDFATARADEVDEDDRANTYMDIRYTYAYLTALYNEEGEYDVLPYALPTPTPGTQDSDTGKSDNAQPQPTATYYEFSNEYLDTLVYPLDNLTQFHDTWAQARSNNTRQHVGTDIRNKEWTNIYSCSSGVVLYTGTDEIPGNYVIILDDKGFEYHYYHLVEVPQEVKSGDRVEAGDLIAHVGDTGNSDVSHLHISLITPSGEFINPYRLMQQLAARLEETP